MIAPYCSFKSLDDMPSLEALGIRNGQELHLSVAAEEEIECQAAIEASIAPVHNTTREEPKPLQPVLPKPSEVAPTPEPKKSEPSSPPHRPPPKPKPTPKPAPVDTPAAPIIRDKDQIKFLWRELEQTKLKLHKEMEQRQEDAVSAAMRDDGTARLVSLLSWSDEETRYYAKLKAEIDGIVGLEPVKEFIVQRLHDAAGRHILKEGKQPKRHVLISGHFGVGKKFAAKLIGKLFALLSGNVTGGRVQVGSRVHLRSQTDPQNRAALLSRMDVGIVTEELPSQQRERIRVQGPSGRFANYREEELVAENEVLNIISQVSDLQDPKTGKLWNKEGTCSLVSLPAGAALSEADGTILDAVIDSGSIVIFTGPQAAIEANMQIAAFRRRQPDLIELPTLGPTELARMIASSVENKGYRGVGEGDVGTNEIIIVLENIVRQRFDEGLIREKNAHLAKDILDLAISRKNDRTWTESLDSRERFRLTPADFGLDVLTADQREKRLNDVEQTVQGLVGWGRVDDPKSPRYFFTTLQQQLQGRAGGGGSPHLPKALWVTANPGVGVDTFVQLATRFLRACGVTTREEVTWVDGAELASAPKSGSSGAKTIADLLVAASRGCFAVRGFDALVDNRESLRDFISALECAETSGMLIILVGTPAGMGRITRMEPSLEARFTANVDIPDFSANELVQFIEQSALNMPSGALTLDDGVSERLEVHINETYGGGSSGKELGERGNLALARQLLQRAIQNRITRLFNRIQGGDRPDASPESECLISGDFEIGAPLGEGEEERKVIDTLVADLIGMQKAKDWFAQVRHKVAFVEQTGTKSDLRVCMNIIITGNPGTGKTTFARLLAKFFHTYGVLSKDSFVEKNGLELKAEYMGGTAPRVKAAVQEAMGGCLFLDEAYALVDSGGGVGTHGDTFSQEAMRTLLTEVENNRTNLMVVLAGYKDKMTRMMRADEGLARRFPNRLHLDDYSPGELASICQMDARKRHQREFEPGLKDKLAKHIENYYWREISQQNAGLSVNLTEKALDRQIVRIVNKYPEAFSAGPSAPHQPMQRSVSSQSRGSNPGSPELLRQRSNHVDMNTIKEEATVFTAADFGIEERPTLGDPEMKKEVQAQIDAMIGMANVKAFFKEMELSVRFVEKGGDPRVLQTSLNLQLTGNPGTGKTTVARHIARYLHAHGILPRDAFVERNALVLKGQFVGQTAPTVVEAVRDAMGGCLFIDEAYALADRGGDKFSGEVVRTLLTEVENHRTGLLVVLAGYADKMIQLMDSDPGLRRRFSLVLELEDYSPDDLALICEKTAKEKFKLSFAEGLRPALSQHIARVHGHEIRQHNGGLAVTLAERAFRRLAMRLGETDKDMDAYGDDASVLLPEDFEIGKYETPTKRASVEASRGQKDPQVKRIKSEWRDAVDKAAELLQGVQSMDELLAEDDASKDAPPPGPGPTREERGKAVAKALAKTREREKQKEVPIEEEQMPIQEGEKVLEEMDTREALEHLGVCPANFEWFEIDMCNPPNENCGICHYLLQDGYRCGGGTHFVCMGCVNEYKTREHPC